MLCRTLIASIVAMMAVVVNAQISSAQGDELRVVRDDYTCNSNNDAPTAILDENGGILKFTPGRQGSHTLSYHVWGAYDGEELETWNPRKYRTPLNAIIYKEGPLVLEQVGRMKWKFDEINTFEVHAADAGQVFFIYLTPNEGKWARGVSLRVHCSDTFSANIKWWLFSKYVDAYHSSDDDDDDERLVVERIKRGTEVTVRGRTLDIDEDAWIQLDSVRYPGEIVWVDPEFLNLPVDMNALPLADGKFPIVVNDPVEEITPRLDIRVKIFNNKRHDHSADLTLRFRDTELDPDKRRCAKPSDNVESCDYIVPIQTTSDGTVNEAVNKQYLPVPPGTYDVYIQGDGFLSDVIWNASVAFGQTTQLDFTEEYSVLIGGDYDGDDHITINDLPIFAARYQASKEAESAGGSVDPSIDFDGDKRAGITDFVLWVAGYREQGKYTRFLRADGGESTVSSALVASNPGELTVVPSVVLKDPGDELEAKVLVDTAGRLVDGVDTVVRYDACVLEVLDVIPGELLQNSRASTPIPSEGRIIIGADQYAVGDGFVGDGILATIRFKAIQPIRQTNIRAYFEPNATYDSNIVETESGLDILGSTDMSQVGILGTDERPELSIALDLGPSHSLRDQIHYLSGIQNLVSLQITDPCGTDIVQDVLFEAFYDSQWHGIGIDKVRKDGWAVVFDTAATNDQRIGIRATVHDINGNDSTVEIGGIILDRTGPEVDLISPEVISLEGNLSLEWTGSDTGSGVESYVILVQEDARGDWTEHQFDASQTLTTLTLSSDHSYTLRIEALDRAGNRSDTNSPPSIVAANRGAHSVEILPADEIDVGLREQVQVTATLAPLSAFPNSISWEPSPVAGQDTIQATFAWQTEGEKSIVVTVVNPDGSTVTDSVTVNVQLDPTGITEIPEPSQQGTNQLYLPQILR